MSEVKIGVVTDSHMGGFDQQIVEALKGENLDVVAFLGDAPKQRDAPAQQHFDQLIQTLQTYDEVDVPVFWIPGNYEDFDAYHAAFGQLEDTLENVTDATRAGSYRFRKNGTDIDFVFVPGARDFSRGFLVKDEVPTGDYKSRDGRVHIFNPCDLEKLDINPEQAVVFAHNPILMTGDNTFDVSIRAIYQGEEIAGPIVERLIREGKALPKRVHAGNALVGRIVDKLGIKKYLSGDIHEAIHTTDRQGNPVPAGIFSREIFGNPGPAKDGRYGVLVYRDDRMATLYSKSVRGTI